MITREKELKKLAKIGRTVLDTVLFCPDKTIIKFIQSQCQEQFQGNGRINWSYARNVAIGDVFSSKATHITTGKKLIEDIREEKRIYLSNYTIKNL